MKTAFLLVCLSFSALSFATETQTECQAMNGEREKIVKDVKTKSKTNSGSTRL